MFFHEWKPFGGSAVRKTCKKRCFQKKGDGQVTRIVKAGKVKAGNLPREREEGGRGLGEREKQGTNVFFMVTLSQW